MPPIRVVLYREADGSVPLQQWLDQLAPKAAVKCIIRIERLAAMGYELRRPEADLLRDGIHELRIDLQEFIIEFSIFSMKMQQSFFLTV